MEDINQDSNFLKYVLWSESWVNRFNVGDQKFTAMYDCNWSRFKPGFNVPAHQSTL